MKDNKLYVGAFVPKNDTDPVLVVICNGCFVGTVFRKDELGYQMLKKVCNGKPEWLFEQKENNLLL